VYASHGGRDKVAAYARGRTCAAEECTTILSTYNPSSYCALHGRHDAVQRRQRKTWPLEQRACPQWSHGFDATNPKRRFCSDGRRMAALQHRRKSAEALARDN